MYAHSGVEGVIHLAAPLPGRANPEAAIEVCILFHIPESRTS